MGSSGLVDVADDADRACGVGWHGPTMRRSDLPSGWHNDSWESVVLGGDASR